MPHHPHVHVILPGGGLSPDGTCWIASRPGFFLPVKVLSQLFRCLLFDGLTRLHKAGQLKFFGDLVGLADQITSLPASRPCAKSNGFSVCGLVKRVSVASVRGMVLCEVTVVVFARAS